MAVSISALPALPLARMLTMSLVEVSPSTESMLKVSGTTVDRARWSATGAMDASVVKKQSMVAMLGQIMPEPLEMPPSLHVLPPRVKRTATSLATVSVVMIASAACVPPAGVAASASASLPMPAAKGSRVMGWPITPVDATMTSPAFTPVYCSTRAHMPSAISTPFALQVFAFPLLQMMACAVPFATCALVTAIGAPFTRFCV